MQCRTLQGAQAQRQGLLSTRAQRQGASECNTRTPSRGFGTLADEKYRAAANRRPVTSAGGRRSSRMRVPLAADPPGPQHVSACVPPETARLSGSAARRRGAAWRGMAPRRLSAPAPRQRSAARRCGAVPQRGTAAQLGAAALRQLGLARLDLAARLLGGASARRRAARQLGGAGLA